MVGIAPAVTALVMVLQYVVMAIVQVMKPMITAQKIVMHLVNVMLVM